MKNPKATTYAFLPRWKISAELRTDSPLHIGSGDTTTHPELLNTQGKEIEINACIKDFNNQPYLSGTTLKGKLLAWLKARIQDEEQRKDLYSLFGKPSKKNQPDDTGSGGRAEFHDARLITPLKEDYPLNPDDSLKKGNKNYPYWRKDRQTYIEISTAINRNTRTVVDRKLFHTELVPPNVGFKVVITGMMTDSQAALIIVALQAFREPEHAATLGAEDTGGKGRMSLYGNVKVARMTAGQASDWLQQFQYRLVTEKAGGQALPDNQAEPDLQMAENALIKLDTAAIDKLTESVKTTLTAVAKREVLELSIQMDGAFLINNPTADKKEADHQPLLDAEGKPLLSGKSLRGALRSQAERIVRSLGLHCCDTVKPCPAIYKRDEVEEKLCPVCQVFGATGWQSPLHIHPFKYDEQEIRPPVPQDFVAIDRFHGGGKHSAKFNARYYFRPKFKGFIELDQRLPDWGKGLLALVLRDLKEGDIKLGFGSNKGYGGVETITPDNFFTDSDYLSAFRDEFKEKYSITAKTQTATNDTVDITPIVSNPQAHTDHYFYNPYQFIPVKSPNMENWLDKNALNEGQHHHSHTRYRQQTDSYHGRLQCKLTAETPFFIGANKLTPNVHPAKVENYTFDNELAIPATSLRGMISSLAEAASNSALRVLDNGLLSYRKKTDANLPNKDRPLSAIGMVIERDNTLKLIPLALPTLEHDLLPRPFERMFPNGKAALKVYLNDACDDATEMGQFLADKTTWTPEHPEIYYLNLDSSHPNISKSKLVYTKNHWALLRQPLSNRNFVIGQNSKPANSLPISAHELNEQRKATWTPGILRILGKDNRDMPNTKKHELFIPVPREFAENSQQFMQTAKAFAITPEAIKRFEKLAKQRTDSQDQEDIRLLDEQRLPYHLKGTARESNHELHLKHGDLVYFRPDDHNQNVVAEVSFSSIWRGRIEKDQQQAAKVFDFFDPNLLPFNSARNSLSPAELLFGFVEGENAQGEKPENALAFAGKVRIDTGRLINPENKTTEQLLEPEITLKILASPKLPSPALYFRTRPPADQTYIAKHQLNPTDHQANGRKHYLHALRQQQDSTKVQKLNLRGGIAMAGDARFPWRTHNDEEDKAQKVKVRPIKAYSAEEANITFEFNVDFDNLTAWELGLLCYALKPSDSYRHKLGMGKPIGLGSVNIDITSLQLIDRQKRYADDPLNADRYNGETLDINALRNSFINTMTMDKNIRLAIELLGDPHNVNAPVHYPQVQNGNIEEKTYRWFVANDRDGHDHQQLTPIDENTTRLHPFNRQ